MQEFHISQNIRRRYELDDGLFQTDGNILFANFQAARKFVQKINERRDADFPESGVRAGDLQAMGLIDEIFHFVIGLYQKNKNPQAIRKLLDELNESSSSKTVDQFLLTFMEIFPPSSVYRGEMTPVEYLAAESGAANPREALLEEVVLLGLANQNPAYRPFKALIRR